MLSLSNLKWPFISLILYANVIFLNVLLRFKCKFNTTKCTFSKGLHLFRFQVLLFLWGNLVTKLTNPHAHARTHMLVFMVNGDSP